MLQRQLMVSCAFGALLLGAGAAAGQQASSSTDGSQTTTGVNNTDLGQRAAPKTQDTGAGSTQSVSEVVVTSANRSSKIQQAPVAITAFTDERRNLLGIENARDITNNTPSMSLQGEYLTLRGVGRYEDPGQGIDPGVAVYVDGVYTSSPAYLNQPDFLADRIEVLRGPQSVFGRNSLGGSVSVYSRRPSDVLTGDLRLGDTSTSFAYADAAISGPITSTLKYRLGYTWSEQFSSLWQNYSPVGSNVGLGTGASRLYEAQLQWDPSSDFSIWGRFQQYSGSFAGGYFGLANQYNTGTPANYTTNLFYGLAPNPQYGLPPNSNPSINDKFRTVNEYPGLTNTHNDYTGTINASYDFHFAKLNYIAGYSQYDFAALTDADGSGRFYFTAPTGNTVPSLYLYDTLQRKKWFSNEINLTSPTDQRLRWVVGVFQYTERYKTNFGVDDPEATYLATPYYVLPTYVAGVRTSPGVFAPPNPRNAFYSQVTRLRTDSQAVYGQAEFDVTRQFKVTVAVRYNWDQRYGGNTFRYVFDNYGVYGDYGEGMSAADVTPAANNDDVHRDFHDWTGKVGLEYHPDSSLTAYVSAAKGYQAGGFDLGGFASIPTVNSEQLYDYEVGLKKQFGSKFTMDLSSYYYDFINLQVPVTALVPTFGGASAYETVLANAQRARSYGVELETIYSPAENLHFTLIYSYLNAKFLKFTGPGGGSIEDPETYDPTTGAPISYANLRGNPIPQSPHNKVSFIPNYVIHTPGADLSLSAIYSYVDPQYYRVFDNPRDIGKAYYNLDLRAVLQPKTNTHITLIAYARNVTNRRQVVDSNSPLGTFPGYPAFQNTYAVNEPFSFGMEAQYRF